MDHHPRLPLPQAPMATIAIPTLDNAATIGALIEHLLNMAPSGTEILVIDSGSRDRTIDIVNGFANPRVRVIPTRSKRLGAAFNTAAEHADPKSQILIRCEAEQLYPHNFISRLLETMRSTSADSVVVSISAHGRTPMEKAIAWASNSFLGNGGSEHRKDGPSGYVEHGFHAAFRMDTFKNMGGYDPMLSRGEDVEYDARLRKAGGKIYLESAISLSYLPTNKLSELWAQYHDEGMARAGAIRNRLSTLRFKHLMVPANLLLQVAAIALAFQNNMALLIPIAYSFALGIFACLTAELKKDWAGLLCIPALLTMHLGWGLGFLRKTLLSVFHRRYRGQPLKSQHSEMLTATANLAH